ncbi:MAG: hypothetical protein ACFFCQ_17835, partial [Promethearchaeota archaeon]
TKGYDLIVYGPSDPIIDPNKISFSISPDLTEWESISSSNLYQSGDNLFIDIDSALEAQEWRAARYLNITVHSGGKIYINAIKTINIDKQLDFATSCLIGTVHESWIGSSSQNKVIIGTVEGHLLVYEYDTSQGIMKLLFNSYTDERYTLSQNIWDMVQIPSDFRTTFPIWKATSNHIIRDLSMFGEINSIDIADLNWGTNFIVISHESPSLNPIHGEYTMATVFNKDGGVELNLEYYCFGTHGVAGSVNEFLYDNRNTHLSGVSLSHTERASNTIYSPPKYTLLSWVDKNDLYVPSDPTSSATASIKLYKAEYSTYWSPYGYIGELQNLELSGQLAFVLEKTQITPTTGWGDMDGDGYEDIILANGKLHLIRNLGADQWEYVPGYFADINREYYLFRNPQVVDFDLDGDFDLVMSERDRERPFYYVNIGSKTSPKWEFHRQDLYNLEVDTNLAYHHYYLPTFEYAESQNDTLSMFSYKNDTKQLTVFEANYESQDSLIVGINPILARVDVNIRKPTPSAKNFGYRILQTWDTEYELNRWTQAIKPMDLDQDGKREIVVGDFDNNIYIFEHMTNNTYKRAYRTPDLSQKLNTTESPYLADELAGINASFIRYIWQHIEQLTGPVDTDGDGLQEFVAVAGFNIYIFEHTGYDDTYKPTWYSDFTISEWKSVFDYLGISQFSALVSANDLNYNGKDEVLLSAGPFLFIFEGIADNTLVEIFMNPSLKNMFGMGSHYILPENGLINYLATYDGSYQLEIKQIATGDFIKNTAEKEIIIVGINRTRLGHEHGFGMIIRNKGVTFVHLMNLPKEATYFNPIYDVVIDDQDYDGNPELILSHAHGVDIWEIHLKDTNSDLFTDSVDTVELIRLSILSNSPSYTSTEPINPIFNNTLSKIKIDSRDTKDTALIALHSSIGIPSDKFYLPKGALLQVFSDGQWLQWAYSLDNGTSWTYMEYLFWDPGWTGYFQKEPDLYQDDAGTLFLIWSDGVITTNSRRLSFCKFIPTGAYGGGHPWFRNGLMSTTSGFQYDSPSIWNWKGSQDLIGVSYIKNTTKELYIGYFNKTSGSFPVIEEFSYHIPFLGNPSTDIT